MIKRIGNDDVYAVVSPVGATVHEFVWHGNHIIAPHGMVEDKSRGGIPICFPFFGSPPESMQSFKKHGWLRHQELDLVEDSDMHVTFEGKNEPTEEYYWKLSYSITVTIHPDKGLELQLLTTRLLDGHYHNPPINPGFHPYFCSDHKNPIARCMARVGDQVITNFHSESQKVPADENIVIKSGEKYVKMVLGGDFNSLNLSSFLTVWSDNNQEYFCVEPILTHPDKFNEQGGRYLYEGGTSKLTCLLTVL